MELREFCDTVLTDNGALAYKSSGNNLIDLFFGIGSCRNEIDTMDLLDEYFSGACVEDMEKAFALLAWSRDCRGGSGNRSPMVEVLSILSAHDGFDLNDSILYQLTKLGYFGDIFKIYEKNRTVWKSDSKNRINILNFINDVLSLKDDDQSRLAAKWFPRKSKFFYDYARYFGLSFSEVRKAISKLTDVVETKMCQGKWSEIDYSGVPSIASIKYAHAFRENDGVRYSQFLDSVNAGYDKINTEVSSPVDIMRALLKEPSNEKAYQTMWDNLDTSFLYNSIIRPLCVADVSGSMFTDNNIPISASLGLSIFLSQNIESAFKNKIVSFSSDPVCYDISGLKLREIVNRVTNWGYTTNISKVYDLILSNQILNPENAPTHIFIFSDMQFDEGTRGSKTPYEEYKEKFEERGLEMPKVVFWNLAGKMTLPAKRDDNIILLSGYSPAVVEPILTDLTIDAMKLVDETVNKKPLYKVFGDSIAEQLRSKKN